MFIKLKDKFESQKIDIKKLRPKKSYDYCVNNRNDYYNSIFKNKKKLKKFIKIRNCPSCDYKYFNKILKKDNLDIVECKSCKTVYVKDILNSKFYTDLYKSENYQKIMKKLGNSSHVYRVNRFGKERVEILKKFLKKKKINMLDVGCSTGYVLEYANKIGWKTTGLEINPETANYGKLMRGLNIFQKTLEDFNSKEKFDVITMFDVLEHLEKPKETIKIAKKLLKKGGLIFVYVPNWNCAQRLLVGEKNSVFINPTHHLTYFTPKTLGLFFQKLKFKTIFWETKGLDLEDYKSFIQKKKNKSFLGNLKNLDIEILQFYINASGNGKNLRMIVKKT
tara:strand:+ start:18556 stop:19560 length:1005 start_codon:yes stop_codon:yes gene_type:complete